MGNKIFEWLGFGTLQEPGPRKYIPEFWPMRDGPMLYAVEETYRSNTWTARGPWELQEEERRFRPGDVRGL